jgi:hypothetical protein
MRHDAGNNEPRFRNHFGQMAGWRPAYPGRPLPFRGLVPMTRHRLLLDMMGEPFRGGHESGFSSKADCERARGSA